MSQILSCSKQAQETGHCTPYYVICLVKIDEYGWILMVLRCSGAGDSTVKVKGTCKCVSTPMLKQNLSEVLNRNAR